MPVGCPGATRRLSGQAASGLYLATATNPAAESADWRQEPDARLGFRQRGFRTENREGESRAEPGELKAAGPSAPGSSAGKGRGSQMLGSGHGLGPGYGWEGPRRAAAGDAPGVAGRRSRRAGALRGISGKVTSAWTRAMPA